MATVLLIDDSAVQVRAREAVLSQAGFEVRSATTVEGALELLRSAPGGGFDAVVTDHIMPQASGAEFVRALRQVNKTVPVIVLTGMAEAESDYAGLGIVFRHKPCPPEELIALVRSTVRSR